MEEKVEERVDRLERIAERFMQEMADFKVWVVKFLEDYRREMDRQIREYKEETDRKIEEGRKELREANKRWGEIANKLGTVVEDIIFPALRPVIEKYFGCEIKRLAMRLTYREKAKGIYEEFDAVAECEDRVFLVEVKSTPREKHIEEFKLKGERFVKYFPAYSGKKLVLIMGSLRFEEDFIKLLSQAGIYAMAYREWEYMDILNFEEVKT